MRSLILGLSVLGPPAVALAATESAERTLFEQVLLYWVPLVVVAVLWWALFRKLGGRRRGGLIARCLDHMDRVEQKLDEISAKLDRPSR